MEMKVKQGVRLNCKQLKLSHLTKYYCTIMIFVVLNMKNEILDGKFASIMMIYHHTNFHIPKRSGLLDTVKEWQVKYRRFVVTMFVITADKEMRNSRVKQLQ